MAFSVGHRLSLLKMENELISPTSIASSEFRINTIMFFHSPFSAKN